MPDVAFNPNDPVQAQFLSTLALGEVGNATDPFTTAFGGGTTAGAPTDAYGFPLLPGGSTSAGPTHAAGAFQFEPGTWDPLAQTNGLNFANPADQEAGAWYLAQQKYDAAGGGSLESALSSGNQSTLSGVVSALKSTWPTLTGSPSAPGGFISNFLAGIGANLPAGLGATVSAAEGAAGAGAAGPQQGSGLLGDIEDWFARGGLIIVGALIVIVALWLLLSSQGVVPSPGDAAKGLAAAIA
ncbi:MAG TPA: hypothetical protein VGG68_09300 [Caulobacteraceae bacterium]